MRTLTWMTTLALAGLTPLASGCNTAEPTEPTTSVDEPAPYVTVTGKGDLPNDSVYHQEHDRRGYRAVVQYFADAGYDLTRTDASLESVWPLRDEHTAVLNRQGTPIQFSYLGYLHSAFDVYRSDLRGDDTVVAPVSGVARVFDWHGAPGYTGRPYATVVGIWDSQTHLVVELMHVEPNDELLQGETEVVAGEPIGRMAAELTWLQGDDLELYRHTHVNVIDGDNMVALDPADELPYIDTVAPRMHDAYLLDSEAATHRDLSSGRLDVVLEVSDRDDADLRNLELGSVAYELRDGEGNVLRSSERCDLAHMIDRLDFESLESQDDPSTRFIDYGSGTWQIAYGGWGGTDFDYPDRTFRYALTQLTVDSNGRCVALSDEEGFVDVDEEVDALHVVGTMWDPSGNATEFEHVFRRDTNLDAGRVMVNEVLPAPPSDYDANGDGTPNTRQDEFIELVNSGTETVSLAGYTIADAQRVRFEFGDDVVLEPGAAVVVFGGGEPDIRTRAQTFAAGSLGLNDEGDEITLFDAAGEVVDIVGYTKSDVQGSSITRCIDADHHARFVQHPGGGASPGLTVHRELFGN